MPNFKFYWFVVSNSARQHIVIRREIIEDAANNSDPTENEQRSLNI